MLCKKLSLIVAAILFVAAQFSFAQDVQRPEKFDALEWRFIGPIVGNRGSVVLGHPNEPNVFFFGTSNGLWKTEDAGTYWEPVGEQLK